MREDEKLRDRKIWKMERKVCLFCFDKNSLKVMFDKWEGKKVNLFCFFWYKIKLNA